MNPAADLVWLLHCCLVCFMVWAPLRGPATALLLAEAGYCLLFLHWLTNRDVCALTLLEQHLRGVEKAESFVHSVVGPVYGITATDVGRLVWAVSLLLFGVGLVRLYKRWIM